MPQRLGFIGRPKWWLVLCCLVIGLALVVGLPNSQVSSQSIVITAPAGKTVVVLHPTDTDQSLVDDTGSIVSDVNYDVTAVDAMDNSKDSGDAGKMTKFDGTSTYTNASVIANAVKVGSTMATKGQTAAAISATPINVILAGTASDTDTLITVTVTPQNEAALTGSDVYQIVITFTASPSS